MKKSQHIERQEVSEPIRAPDTNALPDMIHHALRCRQFVQQKKLERIQRRKQRYENMTPKQRLKADAQEEKRKRRKALKKAKGKIRIAR